MHQIWLHICANVNFGGVFISFFSLNIDDDDDVFIRRYATDLKSAHAGVPMGSMHKKKIFLKKTLFFLACERNIMPSPGRVLSAAYPLLSRYQIW